MENIVSSILSDAGAKNIKTIESAVIYQAEKEILLNCINNQFIIVTSFWGKNLVSSIKGLSGKNYSMPVMKGKTFRVVAMDCGRLVPVPNPIMMSLEKSIMDKTGLKTNRAKPDIEIWVNRRNDNQIYFMVRTRKHASFEKMLQKGELKPDIVDAMLHQIKVKGILADPFGGSGAIAHAAAGMPQFKSIYTGDINEQSVDFQSERLRRYPHCHVCKWDALNLPFEDASVDSIVTDPPWGEYQAIEKDSFYDSFIKESKRILKADGCLVFLSSSVDQVIKALNKYAMTYNYFEIMISGKNVRLYISTP